MPKRGASDVEVRNHQLVCRFEYHEGRRTSAALKYRLRRRAREVALAIERHHSPVNRHVVVDIGTADTLMLQQVRAFCHARQFIGIDMSLELLSAGDPSLGRLQANALALPLATASADVVVCTAVLEHVSDPRLAIAEVARVLKPGGLYVVTTADPVMLRFASRLGAFDPDEADRALTRHQVGDLLRIAGFSVLESRKFMLSHIGFPFERSIERALTLLHLDVTLLNQIVVARRGAEAAGRG